MQYICLIYGDMSQAPVPGTAEFDQLLAEYGAFTNMVKERGALVSGDALQPVSTASTVRVRGGKTQTTDGPFAETKETLGGYYLLECKDLDEAIELAAQIPTAKFGSIEVRPVQDYG